ncbi:uncharacterized protein LY79DRAFT_484466, partial [Colletotrichum navitas]
MPESKIIPVPTSPVAKPAANFTGDVYMKLINRDEQAAIATVTFTPCARTHWHTHAGGPICPTL